MKKVNYFFIDETGHINNDSPIFIYGCIKTDTPKLIEEILVNLKEELADDPLLMKFGESVMENNFHATDNIFDIRTAVFRLLPFLNFRAYFTVLIKQGAHYKKLKSEKEDFEIIQSMLNKITIPRIKTKDEIYNFYYEDLKVENSSLNKVLEHVFFDYKDDSSKSFEIVNKSNNTMPVVDYLCYVLYQIFTAESDKKIPDWAIRSFNSFKDKIALIHIQNDDTYFSRRSTGNHEISVQNLRKKLVVA